MLRFIAEVFGWTMDEVYEIGSDARCAYKRFSRTVVALVLVVVGAGMLCNASGFWAGHLIMGFLFTAVATYWWFDPVKIVAVISAGAISGIGDRGVRSEVERFLLTWLSVWGQAFLWVALFFYAQYFLHLPWWAVLPLAFGLTLLALLGWRLGFRGHNALKVSFGFVAASLVVMGWTIFQPKELNAKVYSMTGFDPATLSLSKTAKKLYEVKRTEREVIDDANAARLELVKTNLRKTGKMSDEDKAFLESLEGPQPKKAAEEVAAPSAKTVAAPAPAEVPRTATAERAQPQTAFGLPRAWSVDGTQTDVSQWPYVEVPPGGDSAPVPAPPVGHLYWVGDAIEIHCVYDKDPKEGIVGDAAHPCRDNGIREEFIHGKGETATRAYYAWAGIGEK